jgi:hypothetical protein
MKSCGYCGRESENGVTVCPGCGLKLVDTAPSPVSEGNSQKEGNRFFSWRLSSIVLIVLAALYFVLAPLNLWMAHVFSQRGEQHTAHLLYWSAFWNIVVGSLCFAGRQMMKRQTRIGLLAGAIVVMAALFLAIRGWVWGLLTNNNPIPMVEVFLIWIPLVYAIIYAYRESRRKIGDHQ